MMENLTRERDHHSCSLAYQLIDKLAVIVGNCDLLRERMELGSVEEKRLDLIRGVAKEIAKELSESQCRLWEEVRGAGGQKHYVV
jgi:hypothetical protein